MLVVGVVVVVVYSQWFAWLGIVVWCGFGDFLALGECCIVCIWVVLWCFVVAWVWVLIC